MRMTKHTFPHPPLPTMTSFKFRSLTLSCRIFLPYRASSAWTFALPFGFTVAACGRDAEPVELTRLCCGFCDGLAFVPVN
jgi:hypothetical protein